MMDDIKSNIKVRQNDCLLYTKNEDDLLATFNFVLRQCQKFEFNLHAIKFVLFATVLRDLERKITKDGVPFDPNNMEALLTMCEPQNSPPSWYSMSPPSTGCVARYPIIQNLWPLFKQHWRNCSKVNPQDEKSCSRSVAATPLETRGASGFEIFTSCHHVVNDVGFSRPKKEDMYLDGRL
jgi:hypothetical protein